MIVEKEQQKAQVKNTVFIGIYCERRERDFLRYNVFVGRSKKSFGNAIVSSTTYVYTSGNIKIEMNCAALINVKRVPEKWRIDMLKHVEEGLIGYDSDKLALVGSLGYCIEEFREGTRFIKVAETLNYYPKEGLSDYNMAKGLPYWIEALTTNALRKDGVTHITTSEAPSEERKRQLIRVGLPIKEDVEVADWLRSLSRGIRVCLSTSP